MGKRVTKPIIISIALLVAALVIYKYAYHPAGQDTPSDKVVEVERVTRQPIQEVADFMGIVRSGQQTTLTAKTKGILNIIATPGNLMPKGELLAKIINGEIERNYRLQQEAVSIARSQLERAQALSRSGVSSKNTVEEKKAHLLEAEKKLSDAKIALEEIIITAPFDGIVGLFKHREGSQVDNGDVIVSFYDPKSLLVEFNVPLSVAKHVSDGSKVWVGGKEYRLTHIQKMLDEETHMCPAYVDIDCTDCIIGTSVDVHLVVQEKESAVVIPFDAIFLRDGKPCVYVVRDGKAALTSVVPGIRHKHLVEITSGLEEGDQVIVEGHTRLYPDVPVVIHAATNTQ